MKTIIAGSRTIDTYTAVALAVARSGWATEISEVVSGGARGVDALGERWALEHGVPVARMPADWKAHGKAAGPLRNEQMAVYADALIAIWDGASTGTADMITRARAHGLRVYVETVSTASASIDDLYPDFVASVGKCDSCGELKAGIPHKGICDECVAFHDLYAAAAQLTEHRAWLRAARNAPPLPPRPPRLPRVAYAPLPLDAHADAIAVGLRTGHSSLEEYRRNPMPKAAIAPPSGRIACLVCTLVAPRALAGHAICRECIAAPDRAAAILESRERRPVGMLTNANAAANAAYDALDEAERDRWRKIQAARAAVKAGTADEATAARLASTQRAIDTQNPRITDGLRNMWVADEALFWASAVANADLRRVGIAREALAACVEELEAMTTKEAA